MIQVYPRGYIDTRKATVPKGVIIVRIAIDAAACDRSPGCPVKRICPRGAVEPVEGGAYPGANGYTVNQDLCTGCALCVRYCPMGAVNAGM